MNVLEALLALALVAGTSVLLVNQAQFEADNTAARELRRNIDAIRAAVATRRV